MAAKKTKSEADPFNRGLAVFIEWGPQQAKPIEERLAVVLGKLSAAEMKKRIAEYQSIQSAACARVNAQVEDHQSEESGRDAVAKIDPRISTDNAAMLYTQARVWAMRDGLG